ncbi:MAG: 6-pyruvoyl trahydropterin synthase family protein [Planctomycetota bacterium]|jgi:6-pyruvoyltetrahydropterin/6-carboxytetrahydropterin synthase
MFELAVERVFRAAHAVTMGPTCETPHDHDWRVTVVVAGDALDDDGLLCDFHLIERELEDVIAGLANRDLNATPPFDRLNPTAEHLARYIAEAIELPDGVALVSVGVAEAPGCVATYRPR